MNTKGKGVICINGDSSKLYQQVIFIMKENEYATNSKKPIDFVSEAEKILNGYINEEPEVVKKESKNAFLQTRKGVQQLVIRKSTSVDIMLNALILLCCVGLTILLLYYIPR